MKITVYLGSSEGNDPSLKKAVKELGAWIGESGSTLVYGGSKNGLMGEIAKSVLDAGGKVIGVEAQLFFDEDLQYEGLTELVVAKNIPERKTRMIELGDAFIAFPGGTGTLEEISEVISMVSLKQLDAPCIIYNLNGYYNALKALLEHMIEKGLSSEEKLQGIFFADSLERIKEILNKDPEIPRNE
ncbi:MAG: TIGR00730 family Rossman fold protein [Firmicutes bacterium]|nr:TIGR00730 family Rossman fold protein [Bacillota bacterium]